MDSSNNQTCIADVYNCIPTVGGKSCIGKACVSYSYSEGSMQVYPDRLSGICRKKTKFDHFKYNYVKVTVRHNGVTLLQAKSKTFHDNVNATLKETFQVFIALMFAFIYSITFLCISMFIMVCVVASINTLTS